MNKNSKQDNMALLVIDVQKGLFERSTPIYEAEKVLKNMNTLIDHARQMGVPVIFIQHSNANTLVKGSDAWHLHPKIQPLDDEVIIHKLHGDAFLDTSLVDELGQRNVSVVFICGLVTHGCVRATSMGALQHGYRVMLVRDAHSSFSKDAAQLIEKWNHALHEQGAALIATENVNFAQN